MYKKWFSLVVLFILLIAVILFVIQINAAEDVHGNKYRTSETWNRIFGGTGKNWQSGNDLAKNPHHTTHKWSYFDVLGPIHWGGLQENYKLCDEGTEQSPINVTNAHVATTKKPTVKYHYPVKTGMTIGHKGHEPLVEIADKDFSLTLDHEIYYLTEIHFHSPGEHYINGMSYPMEIHYVHKNANGKLAVVGIFLRLGAKNAFLDTILENGPEKKGEKKYYPDLKLDVNIPLSIEKDFYYYQGSLTTPPCTEGVKWIIAIPTGTLSEDQLREYHGIYGYYNARPIQPLHSRKITLVPFP